MGNIIAGIIILSAIGIASFKIYKDKKNNVKCSGCPSAKTCGAYKEQK